MIEHWIDIPNFSGLYQISSIGRVRYLCPKSKNIRFIVGSTTNGYRKVTLKIKYRFYVHRLMYILFVGPIPEGYEIDHKDRDKTNNILTNLRLVTRLQNMHNTSRSRCNTSGYKGVFFHNGKRDAGISFNNKKIYIGRYNTAIEAAHAYDIKALELHKDYAVLNFPKEALNGIVQ